MTDMPQFESLEQMSDATAAKLAAAAASAAFQLYQDKGFRRLLGFEELIPTEQDRVFNELVVAELVLIMLVLEAPDLRVADEYRAYLKGLNQKIPKAHVDLLRAMGVADEHLETWRQLITMRYEEYARDRHEVRAAAMKIESAEKDLDLESLSQIQLLVPVQAVAIGCHHHVCRGVTEGQDELFKTMLVNLGEFYVEIRIRFEGGELPPLARARLALRKLLRRLRSN